MKPLSLRSLPGGAASSSHPEMSFDEIALRTGISRHVTRKLYLSALRKLRARAPWLFEVLLAAERVRDRRSPGQLVEDAAVFDKGDE